MRGLGQNGKGRRLCGLTLTEAAVVLGIVGLVLGAIWSAAGSVSRSQKSVRTTQQLAQLVQGIKTLTATTNSGLGLNPQVLMKAGVVPKEMYTDPNGKIYDLWGGEVEIDASVTCPGSSVSNSCVRVVFNALPAEACADLLVRNAGPARDSSIMQAGVSSSLVNLLDSSYANIGINVVKATSLCGTGTGKRLEFWVSAG